MKFRGHKDFNGMLKLSYFVKQKTKKKKKLLESLHISKQTLNNINRIELVDFQSKSCESFILPGMI